MTWALLYILFPLDNHTVNACFTKVTDNIKQVTCTCLNVSVCFCFYMGMHAMGLMSMSPLVFRVPNLPTIITACKLCPLFPPVLKTPLYKYIM